MLLSKNVALVEGVLALALLVALQYAVAWLSTRPARVRRAVKSEPALLFFAGRMLEDALRRERLTRDEVLAAVRAQGIASLDEVAAVMLETDGSVSVLGGVQAGDTMPAVLADVRGAPPSAGAG